MSFLPCEFVEISSGTQDEHDYAVCFLNRAEEILQDLARCSLFPNACFTKNSTLKTQEMQQDSTVPRAIYKFYFAARAG